MIPWKKELVEINLGEIPTENLPATRPIPFDPSLIVKNVNNSNFIFRANFNGIVEYTSNFDYNEYYGSISIYFDGYVVEVGNGMEIKKKDDVNPNKIYTFDRTLGTAFTVSEVGDLLDGIGTYERDAYVDFSFNGAAVHLPVLLTSSASIGISAAILNLADQSYEIATLNWTVVNSSLDLDGKYMSKTNTHGAIIDATNMFAQIPCKVTILYHPMPDNYER